MDGERKKKRRRAPAIVTNSANNGETPLKRILLILHEFHFIDAQYHISSNLVVFKIVCAVGSCVFMVSFRFWRLFFFTFSYSFLSCLLFCSFRLFFCFFFRCSFTLNSSVVLHRNLCTQMNLFTRFMMSARLDNKFQSTFDGSFFCTFSHFFSFRCSDGWWCWCWLRLKFSSYNKTKLNRWQNQEIIQLKYIDLKRTRGALEKNNWRRQTDRDRHAWVWNTLKYAQYSWAFATQDIRRNEIKRNEKVLIGNEVNSLSWQF